MATTPAPFAPPKPKVKKPVASSGGQTNKAMEEAFTAGGGSLHGGLPMEDMQEKIGQPLPAQPPTPFAPPKTKSKERLQMCLALLILPSNLVVMPRVE
jgi:hypothetical protein